MEIEDCFFDTSDYEMTNKKLGEGAFGKVYVVESENSDILYCVKIINTNGAFSSRDQKVFLRESLILHKLSHPSIVKFYGINFHSFDDPTILNPTILTEYIPNGSLKDILDKEKKSIADNSAFVYSEYQMQ
ncbi:Talin-1 [Tritrichomonas musculus]|uniref:non-specific serine/threonine protein kinase n=1 Tax=Tritrichomonas musculus TaxID=1915356 RepID=A0ABR2HGU6_9EUKA